MREKVYTLMNQTELPGGIGTDEWWWKYALCLFAGAILFIGLSKLITWMEK